MIRTFRLFAFTFAGWLSQSVWGFQGTEVPDLEKFALATDRQAVLDAMVPGTDEHYWLTCLHLQHQGRLAEVDGILPVWEKVVGQTQYWHQITTRQALLKFETQPKYTQEYLTRHIGLRFDHQRRLPPAEVQLPTSLDPNLISLSVLLDRELRERPDLSGLTQLALERLNERIANLNVLQRRQLLHKIEYPDFPGLVELVAQELKQQDSAGFGSIPIHSRLTTPQLDQLRERVPALEANDQFVRLRVGRMHSEAGPLTEAAATRVEDLRRIVEFLQKLPVSQNSHKAAAMHELLRMEADSGNFDQRLFLEYLKLPRHQAYFHPTLRQGVRDQTAWIDLSANYQDSLRCLPPGDDTTIVERYLQHFLSDENKLADFQELIEDQFLQRQLAVAQVLAGKGQAERWTRVLGPSAYRELVQRVELEFAQTGKIWYQPEEAVRLALQVKNVDQLVVRVYELNTLNNYRDRLEAISANLSLDGLVPNLEKRIDRKQLPALRTTEWIELPELTGRGVFLVDIIGGGTNVRTLVRKGRLICTTQVFTAGHAIQVLDETCSPLTNASVWVNGQRFEANEQGFVVVPFLTEAPTGRLILQHEDFADLADVMLSQESWTLHADLVVNRESLLAGSQAEIMVRPQLKVSGQPVPIANRLQDVVLKLTSVDVNGERATREYRELKLDERHEWILPFLVPQGLRTLSIELQGRVRVVSQNRDEALVVSKSFQLNQIDATSQILGCHLLQADGQYRVEVLGRNGEPRSKVATTIELHTIWSSQPVSLALQTDERGQVLLGNMANVHTVTVNAAGAEPRSWNLTKLQMGSLRQITTATAGETLKLPLPIQPWFAEPVVASAYRLKQGAWDEMVHASLEIRDGWIQVPALPEGEYVVRLNSGQTFQVALIEGKQIAASIINPYREATHTNENRPTVVSVQVVNEDVAIQLSGAGPNTRVHVFASRYVPSFPPTSSNVSPPPTVLRQLRWEGNRYVAARALGDEYLYILGRRGRTQLAGNMLDRPSLLLAPWALGETTSEEDFLKQDQAMMEAPSSAAAPGEAAFAGGNLDSSDSFDHANLDFLAQASKVIDGLGPNENGRITLPLASLGKQQYLTIMVVDVFSQVVTSHSLPVADLSTQDLRLVNALPVEKPVALSREATALAANESLEISDLLTSRFAAVASLEDAWTMMLANTQDAELSKFEFLIRWSELDNQSKYEKYQSHACHEVNYFLYRKDRAFFDQVVRPVIEQRRVKTFFDEFLLERDLSHWTQPWQFARLNDFEKILLAQRLPEQRSGLLRQISDRFALFPPDDTTTDRLFDMALAGRALEPGAGTTGDPRLDLERDFEQTSRQGQPDVAGGGMAGRGRRSGTRGALSDGATNGPPGAPANAGEVEQMDRFAREKLNAYFGDSEVSADDALYALEGMAEKQLEATVRGFYQQLRPTLRWVEYHYWRIQQSTSTADRINLNRFWYNFANHDAKQPFLDWHFLLCNGNVSESILALAVLDLSPHSAEPKMEVEQRRMSWTSPQPAIVFHQQLQNLPQAENATPVMVSENFFDAADRYRIENQRNVDKFISDQFYTRRLYGAQVVVTNPTGTPQAVRVLTQIPAGAIAVGGSQETKTQMIELPAFGSVSQEYWFYFPTAGEFAHFPSQVSDRSTILASARIKNLNVIDEVVNPDLKSWEHVSQNGSLAELLSWIETGNVGQVELNDLAWRMKDKAQYTEILNQLSQRFVFHSLLWSYSVYHLDAVRMREYLEELGSIHSQCGLHFSSPLLNVDADQRRWYEHVEYSPLINSRSHQVGSKQRILNGSLASQYAQFLQTLVYRPALTHEDRLAIVYYLLTQERIGEALTWYGQIDRTQVAEKMPYDYAMAWLALVQMDLVKAREVASRYSDFPLPLWQQRFAAINQVVAEAEGAGAKIVDPDSALQQQTAAASNMGTIDVEATSEGISLRYRNAATLRVHYHLMDVELLFSRDPFSSQARSGLTLVKPNHVEVLEIPPGETQRVHRLPEHLQRSNVMVEVSVGQQMATTTVYANNLDVQVVDSLGQLQVRARDTQQVLPATYVKVFGKKPNGEVVFVKDGYTDVRGRIDYITQSSVPVIGLEKLAILVSHPEHGSVIRQANLP
ncbi:MAG: hypothetical protein JNL67_00925 [Planctomycetaceae bacterium]|nr:hypothetical protein [Planctomycetaceae bacterium]